MTFNEIVEKILGILDTAQNALLVAETVFLILMNRKLGKIEANAAAVAPKVEENPVEAVPVDTTTLRKDAIQKAHDMVELYFSSKEDKDLTEEEIARIKVVQQILEVK